MKLFLVSRRDISPGRRAAMFCHASREFTEHHRTLDAEWYEKSNTLALLETENLESLTALAEEAEMRGIPVARFVEPDLGDVLAAIAIAPSGRRLVRDLPLAFSN